MIIVDNKKIVCIPHDEATKDVWISKKILGVRHRLEMTPGQFIRKPCGDANFKSFWYGLLTWK